VRLRDQHHHSLARPGGGFALPALDESISRLPADARAELGRIWQRRASSELDVGAEFAFLAQRMFSEPATPEVRALLARAVADEARHSEICREVASRYFGSPVEVPVARRPEPIPFGDTEPRVSLLLELVLLSCLSEVVATFWLRDALGSARAPVARAATRELLADDVDHARIGWAHLSSSAVSVADKHHVAGALPTLLRITHASWCSLAERTDAFFAEHGCPGRSVGTRAFFAAAEQVIVPGMKHVGVDPALGVRWLAENVASPVNRTD
jgi:hypothetical protein